MNESEWLNYASDLEQLATIMSSSRVRPLVLTFDAFGTLFEPRQSIGQQYADAARTHGLTGLTNQHVEASFRKGEGRWRARLVESANTVKAFQSSTKDYPIYGKAAGMDPRQWWANVSTLSQDHVYPDDSQRNAPSYCLIDWHPRHQSTDKSDTLPVRDIPCDL